MVRALKYENLNSQTGSLEAILTQLLANLGVVVESTEEGCVENKKSTEQPLVETKLSHMAEKAVKSHL